MMSKKDYKKFAELFRLEKETLDEMESYMIPDDLPPASEELERIVGEVAYLFEEDNPEFDREKFFIACGRESE